MYSSEELRDRQWAAVIPQSLQRDGQAFLTVIREVSRGMAFNVGEPHM